MKNKTIVLSSTLLVIVLSAMSLNYWDKYKAERIKQDKAVAAQHEKVLQEQQAQKSSQEARLAHINEECLKGAVAWSKLPKPEQVKLSAPQCQLQ